VCAKLKEFEKKTPKCEHYSISYRIPHRKMVWWNQSLPLYDDQIEIEKQHQRNSKQYADIVEYFHKLAAVKVPQKRKI